MKDTILPVFQVNETALTQILIGYLRERKLFDAIVAIQLSLGIGESNLGQELQYLQNLTLEGRWEDVLSYIYPLKKYLSRFEQIEFYILRQQFLEALSWQGVGGQPLYSLPWRMNTKSEEEIIKDKTADMSKIVSLLEILEKKCSSKDFNSLCLCLTVETFKQHPEFSEWTVSKGRLDCFQMLRETLGNLLPGENCSPSNQGSLRHILSLALTLQITNQSEEEISKLTQSIQGERESPIPTIFRDGKLQVAGASSDYMNLPSVDIIGSHPDGRFNLLRLSSSSVEKNESIVDLAGSIEKVIRRLESKDQDWKLQEEKNWEMKHGWDKSIKFSYSRSDDPPPIPKNNQNSMIAPDLAVSSTESFSNHVKNGPLKQPVAWMVDIKDGNSSPSADKDNKDIDKSSKLKKTTTTTMVTKSTTAAAGSVKSIPGVASLSLSPSASDKHKHKHKEKHQEKPDTTTTTTTTTTTSSSLWEISPPRQKLQSGGSVSVSSPNRKKTAKSSPEYTNTSLSKLKLEGKKKLTSQKDTNEPEVVVTGSLVTDGNMNMNMNMNMEYKDDDSVTVPDSIPGTCSVILPEYNQKSEYINTPPIPLPLPLSLPTPASSSQIAYNPTPSAIPLLQIQCPIRSLTIIPSLIYTGKSNPKKHRKIHLVLGTNDRSLKLLAVHNYADSRIPPPENPIELLYEWTEVHRGSVYCTDVLGTMNGKDSDSCIIATGSNDKCIRIYRVDSKEMSPPMKGHTGTIRSLKFYRPGSYPSQLLLSVGSGDFCPRVWELNKGTCRVLDCHMATIHACAWINKNILVTGCEDGLLLFHCLNKIDSDSSSFLKYQFREGIQIFAMEYLPDMSENGDNYKGFLILGCNGGNLIIMSISNTSSPSCEVVSVNQIHDDDIRWIDISYHNNQTVLLTTSFDGKSKIWVLEKNNKGDIYIDYPVSELRAHSDKVLCGSLLRLGEDKSNSSSSSSSSSNSNQQDVSDNLLAFTSGADGKALYWQVF